MRITNKRGFEWFFLSDFLNFQSMSLSPFSIYFFDGESPLNPVEIRNTKTGESIQILPNLGARLNSVVLNSDGSLIPVLEELISPELKTIPEKFRNALLFPFAGRIPEGKYRFNEKDYQFPVNYTMENNACHGFVFDMPFEILSSELTEEYGEVSLFFKTNTGNPGFPFPFEITISYQLLLTGEVTVCTEIKNSGINTFPFTVGWHPLFLMEASTDSWTMERHFSCQIELDPNKIPTGEIFLLENEVIPLSGQFFDSIFAFEPSSLQREIVLKNEIKNRQLRIWQDENFRFQVIYTPEERQTIAIEPMSGNVNAFNSVDGLSLLKPGETWRGTWGFEIR